MLTLIQQQFKNAASLCSPAQVHITTLTGSILASYPGHEARSIPEGPEMRIPPYYEHIAVVSMVSTLEGLHCIILKFAHTCIEGNAGNVGKASNQLHATRIFI